MAPEDAIGGFEIELPEKTEKISHRSQVGTGLFLQKSLLGTPGQQRQTLEVCRESLRQRVHEGGIARFTCLRRENN